jgi:hypothetical protein
VGGQNVVADVETLQYVRVSSIQYHAIFLLKVSLEHATVLIQIQWEASHVHDAAQGMMTDQQ